jgi:hypothetical protein
LKTVSKKAVMLFRPSMVKDLKKAECLENSSLIYSLWPGYLKEEKLNWFHDWLDENKIPLIIGKLRYFWILSIKLN